MFIMSSDRMRSMGARIYLAGKLVFVSMNENIVHERWQMTSSENCAMCNLHDIRNLKFQAVANVQIRKFSRAPPYTRGFAQVLGLCTL